MSITPQTSKIYSGFTPTSIPWCSLWLDAYDSSSYTLSGSNVTQWRDKSLTGLSFAKYSTTNVPTYSSTGLNSRPTITFSNSFLQSSTSINPSTTFTSGVADTSIYGVIIITGDGSKYGSLYGLTTTDNNYVLRVPWGNSYKIWDVGGDRLEYPATTTNGTYILSMIRSGATMTMYFNGTSVATMSTAVNSVSTTSQAFNIGTGTISAANIYSGSISEFLIYKSGHNLKERQQVEGYLARKWGLTSNLPATHPFKNVPLYTQPFQPIDIDGCTLWLDAADKSSLALSGSTVVGWRDKSLNAYTGSSSGSPTLTTDNGLPAISFNGSTQYFDFGNVNNFGTSQMHIFSVVRFTNTYDGTIIAKSLYGPGAARYSLLRYGSNLESFNNDTTAAIADSSTSTRIVTFSWDRSTLYLYVNGTQSASTSNVDPNNLSNTNNLLVGAYNNGSGGVPPQGIYFTGYIMEIVMYQTTITTPQRQQVESYLAKKWGLQSSLPSTHPFKLYPTLTTLFNPLQIPGCQLWLDAADKSTLTLSSSNVTQWNDKSGNAKHASQASSSNQPIYTTDSGLPAISFTRTSGQYLTGPSILTSTSYSIFVIYRTTDVSSIQYIFFDYKKNTSTSSGQNFVQLVLASNLVQPFIYYGLTPTTYKLNNTTATSTNRVLAGMRDSPSNTTQNFYINGTLQSTTLVNGGLSNTTADDYGYTLGTLRTTTVDTTNSFNGYINEIIIYLNEVTDNQRQQIEGYLAQKWNMRVLPSTHPYRLYSTPFTPSQISGLSLWLDAASDTTNTIGSSSVTSIPEKTKTYTVNTTGSITLTGNSLNGLPGYTLGTYMAYTSTNFNWNVNYTHFIVAKTNLGRYLTSMFAAGTSNYSAYVYTNNWPLISMNGLAGNDSVLASGTSILTTTSGGVTAAFIFCLGYTSGSSVGTNYTLNGTTRSTTGGLTTTTNPTVGPLYSNGNANGSFDTSTLYEELHFTTSLTATQRQQVEGYLANKWGLQSILPSNHPYRYFKP